MATDCGLPYFHVFVVCNGCVCVLEDGALGFQYMCSCLEFLLWSCRLGKRKSPQRVKHLIDMVQLAFASCQILHSS